MTQVPSLTFSPDRLSITLSLAIRSSGFVKTAGEKLRTQGRKKMPNWFDEHLIVTGLSDRQNELIREIIIDKLIEGEEDA
jgi:hypothetical protein